MGADDELEQALGASPDAEEPGLTDVDSATILERPYKAGRAKREEIARGTPLGRYIIVEELASGGMGVVYIAYDPELHRRVAIKLLHPLVYGVEASAGRARLLREAQAIARLSHPNVVHVYDVGMFRDAVFLALEFIDGENLQKWLKTAARPWQEVVRVFVAAGRGLAAAHAAGLVHRDFKPENVLIGKDGRVLVTDFGLARDVATEAIEDDTGDASEPPRRDSQQAIGSNPGSSRTSETSIPSTPLGTPLTRLGSIMGTPGYAAPEHVKGAVADALSDQFSFAAALYAGVFRKRAFRAKSFKEYRLQLDAGLPEPPAGSGVPARIRKAIERGLAIDPAQRFASMDAMIDELSRDPNAVKKRVLVGAAAAGVIAVAIGVTAFAASGDGPSCDADDRIASIWNAQRKEAVRAAFVATSKAFAQSAYDAVAKRLDERAGAWRTMRRDACKTTPESVMVLRMACLDRRLREVDQLVDVFANADGVVVERAVGATSALSPLDDCADIARLTAAVAPPRDAATRAKVDALRAAIGKAKALTDAGKYKDGHAIAKQAAADARALDYKPLVAEALVQLGELESYLGEREQSTVTLREAIRLADAARDDATRARAYAWLAGVVGYDLEKTAEGLALAGDTFATLERLGGEPRLEATLESNLGRIYSASGDYEKMYQHHVRALEIRRAVYGEEDPNTANAQNNVAAALHQLGRITEALAGHQKALAMREKTLGKDHPWVAMSLSNIGSQYYELGRLEEGVEITERSLAIGRTAVPAKSPLILIALGNKAAMLGELGRFDDARAAFDELVSTIRADQPKSLRMARALANYSSKLLTPSGHPTEGLARAEEALALTMPDATNDERAMALLAKAEALEALGKLDESVVAHRASMAIYEASVGKDTPPILDSLLALGRIALAKGNTSEAVAVLTRALAIAETGALTGKWLARARFELARAVATADKPRAFALAEQARGWYAAVPTLASELSEIDRWLASQK